MRADRETIRLFQFRPRRGAFDTILRDVLIPDLARLPGVGEIFVGRHGPDEIGPRLVASIWDSHEAMAAVLGVSFDEETFHPELLLETTDRRLEVLPLSFIHRAEIGGPPTIMRLVSGRVRPDELEDYIAEAWAGTRDDAAAGLGPTALYLAACRPDSFRTLSLWPDWETLEVATGGDIDRPIATRHAQRLVAWSATHFEVVPDLVVASREVGLESVSP